MEYEYHSYFTRYLPQKSKIFLKNSQIFLGKFFEHIITYFRH